MLHRPVEPREYTSGEFRREIRKLNLRQSIGRTGICYDNAAAESFFGLLKAEIGTTVWESREAARADVFHFIEVEYNRTRLRKHPEFGYLTPPRNPSQAATRLHPGSVRTRCPRSGWNFNRTSHARQRPLRHRRRDP
ncbi:integrase core domain-containing protein [Kitasatospora sp. NPDC101235]|uniref:integrase core domain-containing protein n=1 Tax=Kitasatospora sp. NPDC101235 TaxID=3364101 RepID=UPI0037FEF616